nr:unnamed protein product [Spirometra erinaceieuropaei]
MHPHLPRWQLLDCVLVWRRRRQDQDYVRRRWLNGSPPRRLQVEAPNATPKDTLRGIFLPNLAAKIFARIPLNRQEAMWFPTSPQNRQHDLYSHQLQVKYQELRTHLYTTSVDLTKALDTENRGIGLVRTQENDEPKISSTASASTPIVTSTSTATDPATTTRIIGGHTPDPRRRRSLPLDRSFLNLCNDDDDYHLPKCRH